MRTSTLFGAKLQILWCVHMDKGGINILRFCAEVFKMDRL